MLSEWELKQTSQKIKAIVLLVLKLWKYSCLTTPLQPCLNQTLFGFCYRFQHMQEKSMGKNIISFSFKHYHQIHTTKWQRNTKILILHTQQKSSLQSIYVRTHINALNKLQQIPSVL